MTGRAATSGPRHPDLAKAVLPRTSWWHDGSDGDAIPPAIAGGPKPGTTPG